MRTKQKILILLKDNPLLSIAEISRKMPLKYQKVADHIRKLLKKGIIKRDEINRFKFYIPPVRLGNVKAVIIFQDYYKVRR